MECERCKEEITSGDAEFVANHQGQYWHMNCVGKPTLAQEVSEFLREEEDEERDQK